MSLEAQTCLAVSTGLLLLFNALTLNAYENYTIEKRCWRECPLTNRAAVAIAFSGLAGIFFCVAGVFNFITNVDWVSSYMYLLVAGLLAVTGLVGSLCWSIGSRRGQEKAKQDF